LSVASSDYLSTNYEVHLLRGGKHVSHKLRNSVDDDVKDRVFIHARIANEELTEEYQSSQIMFMPFRSEGSSVAEEALLEVNTFFS
jgi:hypothetical protein